MPSLVTLSQIFAWERPKISIKLLQCPQSMHVTQHQNEFVHRVEHIPERWVTRARALALGALHNKIASPSHHMLSTCTA